MSPRQRKRSATAAAILVSALFCVHASNASESGLLVGDRFPVLSDVRVTTVPDGVLVSWRVSRDADGIVNWGPTRAYGSHRSSFAFTRSHEIRVPAAPGEYYMALRSCLREPAGVCSEVTGLRFAVTSAPEDRDVAPPEIQELSVEDFYRLQQLVADALISDCDPDSYYCIAYTALTGRGPIIRDGARVTVRYSAWVAPDMAQVDSAYLRGFDTASAPVRNRKLTFEIGESDLRGLELALVPTGAEALGKGAVIWIVMPPEIAGPLRDGLPPIPPDGGVAAKVAVIKVASVRD